MVDSNQRHRTPHPRARTLRDTQKYVENLFASIKLGVRIDLSTSVSYLPFCFRELGCTEVRDEYTEEGRPGAEPARYHGGAVRGSRGCFIRDTMGQAAQQICVLQDAPKEKLVFPAHRGPEGLPPATTVRRIRVLIGLSQAHTQLEFPYFQV